MSLFLAIMIFMIILFIQLCLFGTKAFTEGDSIEFGDLWMPYKNTDMFKIIKSICCMLVAYSFTINLFPIYSALKVKTNENCNKTVSISIFMVAAIYVFLSIVCLLLFGSQLDI